MTQVCPNCGATVSVTSDAFCTECREELLPPSLGQAEVAGASADTRQLAPISRISSWMVVLLSAFLCAWSASSLSDEGTFSLTRPSVPVVIGGCIGVLLGLGVCLDNWIVERRTTMTQPSPLQVPDTPSNTIAILMLLIPAVAGVLIWQHEALGMPVRFAHLLNSATILSTAVLGYWDMRRLALRIRTDPTDIRLASPPILTYLTMLAFWLVGYPAHFLTRWRHGASNFIVPALAATMVYCIPFAAAWFSEPSLPSVGSPEVVSLVVKTIENDQENQAQREELGTLQVSDPVELSFDPVRQRRVARAKVTSNLGEQEFFYTLEWHDRKNRIFAVQIHEELPP